MSPIFIWQASSTKHGISQIVGLSHVRPDGIIKPKRLSANLLLKININNEHVQQLDVDLQAMLYNYQPRHAY